MTQEATNGERTEEVSTEDTPESGEQPKKKTWIVHRISMDPQELEDKLNASDEDGYDVYDLDYERGVLILKLDGETLLRQRAETYEGIGTPMSLGDLLRGLGRRPRPPRAAPPSEPVQEPVTVESRPTPGFEIEGALTPHLFNRLNGILMTGAGEATIEKYVKETITELFKVNVPRIEVEKSLQDVKNYYEWHVGAGGKCSDNCLLEKVFTISQERLKAHLEANPAN
jgi:hypothetical protein